MVNSPRVDGVANTKEIKEKKMKKLIISLCLVLIFLPAILFAGGAKEQPTIGWKPTRTITLIVPWGAGGSSDLTARVLAGEMEKSLGVKIAVVNQPGASGATGTKAAYDAPKDGYTWVGNADMSIGLHTRFLDLSSEISHRDRGCYLADLYPSVNLLIPNSPIKDWDSLVQAFKTRECTRSKAQASGQAVM
jgi:tripartite-type tricarboxylate transporter receptor subunit TctC